MKTLSPAARQALAQKRVILSGAASFQFGATWNFWSGDGELTLPGLGLFKGISARALLTPLTNEVGGGADGVRLQVSGLETQVAVSIEEEDYRQKPVTIWRLIFSTTDQSLLHQAVYFRGRVDTIMTRETRPGESQIEIVIEGSARDMSRANGRMRSDADQRLLGGAADGGMKHISTAPDRTLNWGQKPSTARSSLPGILGQIISEDSAFARLLHR